MISNQILQSTLEGIKEITGVELCILDAEGNVVGASDGLRAPVAVSYVGSYDAVKQVLAYIAGLDDRMVISAIDITYESTDYLSTWVNKYYSNEKGKYIHRRRLPRQSR